MRYDRCAHTYRVERGSPMRRDLLPGLYRWVLSGKLPTEMDPDKLRGEEGQLVLPGVTGFRVEVPVDGEERRKEYKGPLPAGLFIALTRGTGKEKESIEDFAVTLALRIASALRDPEGLAKTRAALLELSGEGGEIGRAHV